MRPSWDEYGLLLAETVALRADCRRRKVGAVLMRPDHSICSVGYVGVAPGERGCLDGGCPRGEHWLVTFSSMEGPVCGNKACPGRYDVRQCPGVEPDSSYDTGPGRCVSTHAETSCLALAREDVTGYTLYCNHKPCDGCKKVIRAFRLSRVVWPDGEVVL